MFLSSLIKELCTKEEKNKTGCSFNFEHQINLIFAFETLQEKIAPELKNQNSLLSIFLYHYLFTAVHS